MSDLFTEGMQPDHGLELLNNLVARICELERGLNLHAAALLSAKKDLLSVLKDIVELHQADQVQRDAARDIMKGVEATWDSIHEHLELIGALQQNHSAMTGVLEDHEARLRQLEGV